MSIPSQMPMIALAARASTLQALALQAGQAVQGTVIGPAPNGGTQVQINGQMLNLLLPTLAKAGTTLSFEVQGSGAQMRLALQATAPAVTVAPLTTPPTATSAAVIAPAPLPMTSSVPTHTANPVPLATTPTVVSPQAQAAPIALPAGATAVTAAVPASATNAVLPAQAVAPAQVVTASVPTVAQPGTVAATVNAGPVAAASVPPIAGMPTASQAAAAAYPQASAPSVVPPGVVVTQVAPPPTPAALAPSTPQAALTQMVQASVPRQDGIGSLTVALSSVAGKVALPEPVGRAAQQVLAGRVNLGDARLDGASLQRAVLTSGLFQEATLVRSGTPLPQADMKTALLTLRQSLTTWLGTAAPLAAIAHIPPPLKGSVPRARAGSDLPPVDPELPPQEIGKQLLERTDAALSRLRLHQHASLPDAQVKAGADWSMDLPVMIGPLQTMMQLQIHRDQHGKGEAESERGWQMRFAINLPELGEVGAQVSLRGTATGVMLWASEDATSQALEEEIGALRETLAEVGLRPGAIIVRHGEPSQAAPAAAGHFVDART